MGRIIASVTIENVGEPLKSLRCDALVDTAASHLVLPKAWMDRLGLKPMQELGVETATQDVVMGDLCGPAKIQIEGFRAIYNEVLFVDMHPADGFYEQLFVREVLFETGTREVTGGRKRIVTGPIGGFARVLRERELGTDGPDTKEQRDE